MLKEMIQSIVKESGSVMRIQLGQLQLAGLSDAEQRAFADVVDRRAKNEGGNLLSDPIWC
ncbi:competence pheromone ComX [Paenibacillus albicereus]|uniref:ComX pheromone n=1 Tax=Paenibacillus albicereus TaxID=2726185 RepID=A0A6H2GSU8_9BACL|nr:competence pheromone ComX [Paenibacillus albicereus]QJC50429.1 competence pheromone ComX [Paenibacillus albicereus]